MARDRKPRQSARLVETGLRVPVLLTPEEHAAFKRACDGRPMAGVLRGLAADYVVVMSGQPLRVGGGA